MHIGGKIYMEQDNKYECHDINNSQYKKYLVIKDAAKHYENLILEFCPSNWERNIAITKLKESVKWVETALQEMHKIN